MCHRVKYLWNVIVKYIEPKDVSNTSLHVELLWGKRGAKILH